MIVQKRRFLHFKNAGRHELHLLKLSRSGLEVRCSVDGTRVVVLVQCTPEGGALGTGGRAGSLLSGTGANSSATHQVIIFLIVLSVTLLLDTPDDDSQNTDHNGTTNTDNNANNDLLVRVGDAAAGLVAAIVAVERRRRGILGGVGSRGHNMGHSGTADSLV